MILALATSREVENPQASHFMEIPMVDRSQKQIDNERYIAAAHAMQSGVKFDQEYGSSDGTSKHLRTGINSAMVNDAAIARLLIEKGLFTEEEYMKAVADEMEKEVARYERILSDKLGRDIKLV